LKWLARSACDHSAATSGVTVSLGRLLPTSGAAANTKSGFSMCFAAG
jgi:hypothetical protein